MYGIRPEYEPGCTLPCQSHPPLAMTAQEACLTPSQNLCHLFRCAHRRVVSSLPHVRQRRPTHASSSSHQLHLAHADSSHSPYGSRHHHSNSIQHLSSAYHLVRRGSNDPDYRGNRRRDLPKSHSGSRHPSCMRSVSNR